MASIDDTLPYVGVGEALRGLEVRKLNDGVIPTEMVALVKGINEDGDPCWLMRYSQGVSKVEVIGALHAVLNHEERVFEQGWLPDHTDDD